MIKIYNETKNAWNIKSQGTALLISKSRKYNSNGAVKKRSIKAITYNNVISDEKVKEIAGLTEMIIPHDLFTDKTEVKFSRKDLTSILSTSNKRNKDIFLISLNLQGRKVVGVSDCMLLEYLLLGGEFSLIVAVRPNTKFRIYLNNKENTRKEIYEFNTDEQGKTTLRIISKENNSNNTNRESVFKPKKFRPATPTHLVLGHESNEETMALTYNKNGIVTFNDNNLYEVVDGLIEKKYRAITLYDVENEIVEFIKKKFDIVYAIDGCLGNLYKLKI